MLLQYVSVQSGKSFSPTVSITRLAVRSHLSYYLQRKEISIEEMQKPHMATKLNFGKSTVESPWVLLRILRWPYELLAAAPQLVQHVSIQPANSFNPTGRLAARRRSMFQAKEPA